MLCTTQQLETVRDMAVLGLSDRFYRELRQSHTPSIRVEVWYDGALVIDDLPITGGTIQLDADDLSRATLSGLTFPDTDMSLIPDSTNPKISVYGHELKIYRGIRYREGPVVETVEEVLMGIFRVQSHQADEFWARPGGEEYYSPAQWEYRGSEVSVDGIDRSANIMDYRLTNPSQPTVGYTVGQELDALCFGVIGLDTSNFAAIGANAVLGTTDIKYQEDRGQAIADLADYINCRAFVTREGELRLEKFAELPDSLVGTERELPPVVDISTSNTRDGIYNAVVARGEAIDNIYPVQAIAYDMDMSKPTYWGGPFGNVPYFFNSPILGTTEAAELAAETRLTNVIKDRSRKFSVTTPPDPTLDPNDFVQAVFPGRDPFPAKIVSISMPLDPTGLMKLELVATEAAAEAAGPS